MILANAVIQWIPGHETLLPALMARLADGGSLAVQTPDNLDEPSHRLMRDIAAEGPWARKLAGAANARAARNPADWYFRLLRAHAAHVDIWRTTYFHPLAGAEAVVEWVKGTGLRPFLDPLDGSEREAYLDPIPGRDRRSLSGRGGRDRAAAVPEAFLRRDAMRGRSPVGPRVIEPVRVKPGRFQHAGASCYGGARARP